MVANRQFTTSMVVGYFVSFATMGVAHAAREQRGP
jgi:hypothetical protein